jgi:ATP/maltotriose-dependent transcriptional regulator MalT
LEFTVRRPIPIDHRSLIHRSRVLALLDSWIHARLVSIVAPTGYGKSTLAAEWLDALDGPLSVWLSLEPASASAPQLARALGEALHLHLPALAEPLTELRAGRLSPLQMAQTLTDELHRDERRLICLLDDYHLVTDPDAHHFTQHILDHAPDHFHLVLLSRTQPPLQFSRLLLHDAAIALDERHLRFDHDEFLAFVHASRLATLSESQRADVERRADGWIAALRLIDLSIPRSTPGSVDALLGPHSGRLLIEHLKAEVFDRLPNDMRTFLVEAAPLPFLTAELLAAATGRDIDACEASLQQALHANLFLGAYESRGGVRYRIHPLFREMLTQVGTDAQAIAAIRRRAAAWLAAHDGVNQALELLLPKFVDDAADLLAAGPLRAALLDFDLVAVRRWLAQLPAAAIDARPPLAVDAVWLVFFAEENGIDQAAARAQASLAACPDADAELRAEAALLTAFGHILLGQLAAVPGAADAALRMPCAKTGLAAGYKHILRVLLPRQSMQPDAVRQELRETEAIFRRLPFAHGALDAASMRAIYAQRIGDAEGACAAFENALTIVRSFGREYSYAAIDLHFFYGDHLYSLDRLGEARTHLEHALAISARSHFRTPSIYHAHVCLQLCDLAEGRPPTSFDPADDAQSWHDIASANIVSNTGRIAWLRLLRDARMNAVERCRRTFDSLGVTTADLTADSHDLLWLATLAGAVLGRAPIDADRVTAQLHDFCRRMEEALNVWIACRTRAILAVHLLDQRDEDGARTAIQPLATRDDCRRLLLDIPSLAALQQDAHPAREPLSEREQQLLQWFATDRTNKEIAQALSISLHTLYTHTQNIYRKLGVHSRKEAVRKSQSREKREKRK